MALHLPRSYAEPGQTFGCSRTGCSRGFQSSPTCASTSIRTTVPTPPHGASPACAPRGAGYATVMCSSCFRQARSHIGDARTAHTKSRRGATLPHVLRMVLEHRLSPRESRDRTLDGSISLDVFI